MRGSAERERARARATVCVKVEFLRILVRTRCRVEAPCANTATARQVSSKRGIEKEREITVWTVWGPISLAQRFARDCRYGSQLLSACCSSLYCGLESPCVCVCVCVRLCTISRLKSRRVAAASCKLHREFAHSSISYALGVIIPVASTFHIVKHLYFEHTSN